MTGDYPVEFFRSIYDTETEADAMHALYHSRLQSQQASQSRRAPVSDDDL